MEVIQWIEIKTTDIEVITAIKEIREEAIIITITGKDSLETNLITNNKETNTLGLGISNQCNKVVFDRQYSQFRSHPKIFDNQHNKECNNLIRSHNNSSR